MKDNLVAPADLIDQLRTLDLASVACSAALDDTGALGAVNLAGKIEAATARHRLGLLHGLVIAEAEQGVDQRLLAGEGDALPLKKAATLAEAIQAIDALSRPRRMVADRIPATFEVFGVDTPQPFDGETYQHLPLLRRVPRERLPRERDADDVDERSRLRDLPLERWDEQLWGDGGQFEEQAVPLEQALRERSGGRAPRLILLGAPGSGKSTVLDYIAHACLRRELPLKIGGGRYLPVKIGLRRWEQWCKDHHRYRLAQYLGEAMASRGTPSMELWDQWLAAGRILVLLDGLDELSGDVDFYEQALKGLLADREVSGCPMILTSRTVSYDAYRRLAPHLPVYTLGGLSPRQQAAFIRRYPAPPGSRFDAEALIAELRRLPNVRPLAANPLLLSILCLVATGPQRVKLPATRGELYDRAVMQLLKRPVRRPEAATGMVPSRMRKLVAEAALELWLDGARSRQLLFSEEKLLAALTRATGGDEDLAEAVLKDLTLNSGLLRGNAGEQYAFLHLTLQEFLVADSLARRLSGGGKDGWQNVTLEADGRTTRIGDLILDKAWDAAWQEVICLLAGRMERPEELLNALLAVPDDACHLMLLVAGRCLGEATGRAGEPAEQIVHRLLGVLRSASGVDRKRAGEVLGGLECTEVRTGLEDALADSDDRVREASVQALGALGGVAAIPGLQAALADAAWFVRATAAGALGAIGHPESVLALAVALTDSNRDVVRAAVGALGTIGSAAALWTFMGQFFDPDWRVRGTAAESPMAMDDAVVVPVLLAGLSDPAWQVRRGAVVVLGERRDVVAVPALQAALLDAVWQVRRDAALALRAIGHPAAVPSLVAALTDPNRDVRLAVALALGAIGDAAAVPGLHAALADQDSHVRWDSVRALGAIGAPAAVPALRDTLANSDHMMRLEAVLALREIGDAATVAMVQTALADPHPWVRKAAAKALGAIGDPVAVEALQAALADPLWEVRRDAAKALAKMGDVTVIPTLIALWQQPDLTDAQRTQHYDLLVGLAHVAIPSLPAAWPALRRDLLPPTDYTLAAGLGRRPGWAKQAAAAYRRVLLRLPGFAPALLGLGRLLAAWPGREAGIRAYLEQHAPLLPDNAEAWTLRGELCDRVGDPAEALRHYKAAVEAESSNAGTRAMRLGNLAAACLARERVDEAEGCLNEAQALAPDHPMLHCRRAEIHLAQSDLPAALAGAERSIEGAGQTGMSAPHFVHGLVLLCLDQADQAAAAYARGIELATEWWEVVGAERALERQERRLGSLPDAAAIRHQLHEAAERLKAAWPPAPEQADD